MGQRPDRVSHTGFDEPFSDEVIIETGDVDDTLEQGDADIQRTREDIGNTLDAIQSKLQPERLTEDVKVLAHDTVDHLLEESKSTAGDVTEIASLAAMEAVDYATKKMQELFPELSQQAQEAANVAVDHAVASATAAVQEMSEQARAAMRDATIGRIERMAHTTSETSKYVGSTTVDRIKNNPGPAALAALGLSWLFMSGKGSGSTTHTNQYSQTSKGHGVNDAGGQMKDTAGNIVGQVQDSAGNLTDHVQDGLDTAMDQVDHLTGQTQQVMSSAADHVQESAGHVSTTVQQVPAKTRRMIEANPVPLGLVAIALGSAAALAIPESRKENELMGEARDALMQSARNKGQEVADKAHNVVDGMQTAVDGVEKTIEKVTK